MADIKIYGIKNCDSMKKAFSWFSDHDIEYDFHDYKKEGVDKTVIKRAISHYTWEDVINRRGTTWRKLDDKTKDNMNADRAINIANDNPSIVKRPLIVSGNEIILGFDTDKYASTFI